MPSLRSVCVAVLATAPAVFAQLSDGSLQTYKNVVDLGSSFNPAWPAYWTNLPHHQRTPFALSPDGKTAYLAHLDASGTDLHVQTLDPTSFASKSKPVTIVGAKEASGLVAHDDGFAVLTNIKYVGVDAPEKDPVAIVVRYKGGTEAWRTWVGGPPEAKAAKVDGKNASPFLAGDLVYSSKAKMYGAYFAITGYGDPNPKSGNGHYADSHEYINDDGQLQWLEDASAHWGCSHSIGIAFEAADAPPYASICADDHTGLWLNTKDRYMAGPKVSTEEAINFSVGEPMGGMSGSYSVLANFPGTTSYIFAWQTRGAVDLKAHDWGRDNCCSATARTQNHNVAVALLKDKYTLAGPEAPLQIGLRDGDTQLNLVTSGTIVDHSNVRVEAFDATTALLSWEQIDEPTCDKPTFGCTGAFSGTYFQLIGSDGKTVGPPIKRADVFVSGDFARMADGRICWPYVAGLTWDLSKPIGEGRAAANTTQMSFACMSKGAAAAGSGAGSGSGNGSSTSTALGATSAPAVAGTIASTSTTSAALVFGTPAPPTTLATSTTTPTGRRPTPSRRPSWPPRGGQPSWPARKQVEPAVGGEDDDTCDSN